MSQSKGGVYEQTEHLPWGWWTEGASVVDPRAACLPEMPKYVSCGQSNWFLKPETNIHLGQTFHWRKVILLCPTRWRNKRRLVQSYPCTWKMHDITVNLRVRKEITAPDSVEWQAEDWGQEENAETCPFCAGCTRVPSSTQQPQDPSKAPVKSSPSPAEVSHSLLSLLE